MEPIGPIFPRYVGACIYCGSESGLQNEHIVPLGLSGEWILLDASCSKCADITSAFEHDVQRKGLLVARSKLRLKTRRKKERPRSFPLNLKVGEETRTLDVPLDEHPGSVIFPKFPPAAALSHTAYTRGIGLIGTDVLHLEKDKLRGLATRHGASAVSLTASYEPVAFARLIGKIAYGFAVACYGPKAFGEVPILASILGKSDEIGRWVGSDLEPVVNGLVGLHAITLQLRDAQLVAFVRLFAQFGTREYHAIVGSLRDHHAAA